MKRVTVGGRTQARSANLATLSRPAIGYEARSTRASFRSAGLRVARWCLTSSPTRDSGVVSFVTSEPNQPSPGTSLTSILSPVRFRASLRGGLPSAVRSAVLGGLTDECEGPRIGRRAAPSHGLCAGARAADEHLLQFRGVIHDHLDTFGLSHLIRIWNEYRRPDHHEHRLAVGRNLRDPRRPVHGGGRLDLSNRGRTLRSE